MGIGIGELLIILILLSWVPLAIVALLQLRRARLDSTALALWVGFIILVPFLGAIAFFIIRPGSEAGA